MRYMIFFIYIIIIIFKDFLVFNYYFYKQKGFLWLKFYEFIPYNCSTVCEVASGLLTQRGRHSWTDI